jgi:tetratricopeptide (TPR) repeat protein
LAILFHSLADFNMHIPANAILAVSLMALLTGHIRFATERYWVTRSWAVRSAFTLLILCGLVFLGKQGAVTAREYLILEEAGKAKRSEQALFKRLKQLGESEELDWEQYEKTSKEIRASQLKEIAFLKQAYAAEPNNFATTYKIGEALRNPGHERFEEALGWDLVGMKLNPWDAYNYLRYGMCLHELNRSSEAQPYFKRAVELDPNSFYVTAHYGWHFYKVKNYGEAKGWLERSVALSMWRPNIIAWYYLKYTEEALQKKTLN